VGAFPQHGGTRADAERGPLGGHCLAGFGPVEVDDDQLRRAGGDADVFTGFEAD
jgi:hypothetical protein